MKYQIDELKQKKPFLIGHLLAKILLRTVRGLLYNIKSGNDLLVDPDNETLLH